jgi:hypothetical protein
VSRTNKAITKFLVADWFEQHISAVIVGLLAVVGAGIFLLNYDGSVQDEIAIVDWSFHVPTRYSATRYVIIAEIADGKTIELGLPAGVLPPPTGKQIRVRRITKLFFGERFVWLGEKPVPTP